MNHLQLSASETNPADRNSKFLLAHEHVRERYQIFSADHLLATGTVTTGTDATVTVNRNLPFFLLPLATSNHEDVCQNFPLSRYSFGIEALY
jgi:hypothetical protein